MASEADRDNRPILASEAASKRRKDLFGDCALVEIIHLHDCLRGALKALQHDVTELSQSVFRGDQNGMAELERRVAGRFKVIWSVFRAHSAAEDEFIWPALQNKTRSRGAPKDTASEGNGLQKEPQPEALNPSAPSVIEQEEYEEDHADEERMFRTMDGLLSKLRDGLFHEQVPRAVADKPSVHDMAKAIDDLTTSLSKHLMAHLEKEETQCLPLVIKHLSKPEIHDLVGQIMGKRSSDTIAQIMTMAVQNLTDADREEMVKYMKQAMMGTFFERWLAMSGWMSSNVDQQKEEDQKISALTDDQLPTKRAADTTSDQTEKRSKSEDSVPTGMSIACPNGSVRTCSACEATGICTVAASTSESESGVDITSQAELEKLIRAIACNSALTPLQKNTTIQGLRDSVWKSNLRQRNATLGGGGSNSQQNDQNNLILGSPTATIDAHAMTVATATRSRRMTPASSYYAKNRDGIVELVWSSDSLSSKFSPDDRSIPLFSAAELAPTFHDGGNGAVLGCPHYARACKLRHPSSGRLYTCRLCCEQEREMPMKDRDSPLDRYAVIEVLCMRCGALQPADSRCINPKCDSRGKPYAKYNCNICNLYDDGPQKNIYHCPFCNVCRAGLGLGIDYRHCMRCNACISLADDEHHCIPQRLQGSCPICHETMFESTEPLRGLKCGHVMHLSCFSVYRRGYNFTCPLCKKSMEDMNEYFSLLDAAVRMQPMPEAYLSTVSNIYCQDCGQSGQVQYHFVGCKCQHCGSYNTRELGRVQQTRSTG